MAKKSDTQISIEYALTKIVFTFFRALPRAVALAFGVGLGRLFYLIFGRLRRVGMRNLEIAFPEMSEPKRKEILLGCFQNIGRQIAEVSRFPLATPESLREMVEYTPNAKKQYAELKAQKRGIIFLTAHLGCWELGVFAFSALEEPISFLARRLDNPRIEDMASVLRARLGNKPIDKKEAAIPSVRLLRDGGTLGILADLNALENEGVFVPFFGAQASTTAGVAALAMRTNAALLPIYCIWDKEKKRHSIRTLPTLEIERPTGDRRKDIEHNTARFTSSIEEMIRAYPGQWLWIHKRWNTRPSGEKSLYDNL